MTKRYVVSSINEILERNNIPWRFGYEPEYPNSIMLKGAYIRGYSSGEGINLFPCDIEGLRWDNYLGICGLSSGNNSLKDVFKDMSIWAKAHYESMKRDTFIPKRKKLNAVIITDKWNVNKYNEYCEVFKYLDIRLVVILVTDLAVQLPFIYSNDSIEKVIDGNHLDEREAEAIKHAAWVVMRNRYIRSLRSLGEQEKAISEMVGEAFGNESDDIIDELRNHLDG